VIRCEKVANFDKNASGENKREIPLGEMEVSGGRGGP
jgi:hypothetical protein